MELLSPAGDFTSFKTALQFGADAVYLGREVFGMRQNPKNFTHEELCLASDMAHEKGKKVYLTVNSIPHNNHLELFPKIAEEAIDAGIDAFIVADLGLFSMLKKYAPKTDIHMSTQTGIVNYETANMLYNLGAKRVVLARELSLDEIFEIRQKTPKELELEVFVHGAMCVSFSGRCLISAYMTGRDANNGACAQPCRWKYSLMEETRPNEYFPVFEDEGTYFFNSKDLCMIDYIEKLSFINSLKIEGRAKSEYYVASVTNAYRNAIDSCINKKPLADWAREEVFKVSHRQYSTGFFFGNPEQVYETSSYVRDYDVVAVIEHCEGGYIYATQRNRFFPNDELEVLIPSEKPYIFICERIFDGEGSEIFTANKAQMKLKIPCEREFEKGCFIRKCQKNNK